MSFEEAEHYSVSRLSELHVTAAQAILGAHFPHHYLLSPREFSKLCEKAEIGRRMGVGALQLDALESLHRLRVVVPLAISRTGSDDVEPLPYDEYTPWSEHGQYGDDAGWTEVYYHPFQVWLVELAEALYFRPVNFWPEWFEWAASDKFDREGLRSLRDRARDAMRSIASPKRVRFERFYDVFPLLVLSDQLVGPSLRESMTQHHDPIRRRYGDRLRGRHFDRWDDLWWRWRRRIRPEHVRVGIGDWENRLKEFAEETWRWADHQDPLAGSGWDDLVSITSWKQLEELKGRAFGCHRIKELSLLAAKLLAFAYGGAYEDYCQPQSSKWTTLRLGGSPKRGDASQAMFVCNRFGINPTPRVLWFVEGESEEACVQAISEARGGLFARAGVRVLNFRGAGQLKQLRNAVHAARILEAEPFVLADRADQRVVQFITRLIGSGALPEKNVLFSDPAFEHANFSAEERAWLQAEAVASGRKFSKPEAARRLTERFVLPEIADAHYRGTDRPIIRQIQAVLDASTRRRAFGPKFYRSTIKKRPAAAD